MSKILCIHPYDKTTQFLSRIPRFLSREIGNEFYSPRVEPWESSHQTCLVAISKPQVEFVIFLGHGRSDSLYGSFSNDERNYTSGRLSHRNSYRNENFISADNIEIFRNKKVFCLSCNSADKIGRLAVESGGKAFIGFGDIPTDGEIVNQNGQELKYFRASFKSEIVKIVKLSLLFGIQHNLTFAELFQTIRMITNTRVRNVLLIKKGIKHRRLCVKHLFEFSKQMRLFGDSNEKILSSK